MEYIGGIEAKMDVFEMGNDAVIESGVSMNLLKVYRMSTIRYIVAKYL
jgi:hypothetical protein